MTRNQVPDTPRFRIFMSLVIGAGVAVIKFILDLIWSIADGFDLGAIVLDALFYGIAGVIIMYAFLWWQGRQQKS